MCGCDIIHVSCTRCWHCIPPHLVSLCCACICAQHTLYTWLKVLFPSSQCSQARIVGLIEKNNNNTPRNGKMIASISETFPKTSPRQLSDTGFSLLHISSTTSQGPSGCETRMWWTSLNTPSSTRPPSRCDGQMRWPTDGSMDDELRFQEISDADVNEQ